MATPAITKAELAEMLKGMGLPVSGSELYQRIGSAQAKPGAAPTFSKAQLSEMLGALGLPLSGADLYQRFYAASVPMKKGDKGDPGPRGPVGPIAIHVSATPPDSPAMGQLWLDIS